MAETMGIIPWKILQPQRIWEDDKFDVEMLSLFEQVGPSGDNITLSSTILFFDPIESTRYPSATDVLLHLPCLFTNIISPPLSANNVADVLRKVCPVNISVWGRWRCSAIKFGIAPNMILPTCWIEQALFLVCINSQYFSIL